MKDDPGKLLFLDLDGVINSNYFFEKDKRHRIEQARCGLNGECREWDLKKLDLLKKIHDETRCTIVMSSSWRKLYFSKTFKKRYIVRQLKKDLKKRGIVINHCTGSEADNELWKKYSGYYEEPDKDGNIVMKRFDVKPDVLEFYERGMQINNYMTKFWKSPIKSFVVLDDDDGDLHLFGENFVQTKWRVADCEDGSKEGLTEELANRCIGILNKGEELKL